jgi:hypothetical protein
VSKQRRFAGRALRVAAVSGFVFATFAPAAAHAANYPDGGDPGDPTEVANTTQVQGASAAKSQTLPFTGGDVAGLALIGAGAVGAGFVAVRASRRRIAA